MNKTFSAPFFLTIFNSLTFFRQSITSNIPMLERNVYVIRSTWTIVTRLPSTTLAITKKMFPTNWNSTNIPTCFTLNSFVPSMDSIEHATARIQFTKHTRESRNPSHSSELQTLNFPQLLTGEIREQLHPSRIRDTAVS